MQEKEIIAYNNEKGTIYEKQKEMKCWRISSLRFLFETIYCKTYVKKGKGG